jgi:hypothetical protein
MDTSLRAYHDGRKEESGFGHSNLVWIRHGEPTTPTEQSALLLYKRYSKVLWHAKWRIFWQKRKE